VIPRVAKSNILVGFFTIGVDAKIAEMYHDRRESMRLHNRSPTSINMARFMYVWYGAKVMAGRHKNMDKVVRVAVDGKSLEFPQGLQNLMFHNVHSSGGGTYHWSDQTSSRKDVLKDYEPLSTCDGKLEVSSLTSLVHLAMARLKISHSVRLAQGSDIVMYFNEEVPVQLDGEPWIQPANSSITIRLAKQGTRLIGGHKPVLNMYQSHSRGEMDTIEEDGAVHQLDKFNDGLSSPMEVAEADEEAEIVLEPLNVKTQNSENNESIRGTNSSSLVDANSMSKVSTSLAEA